MHCSIAAVQQNGLALQYVKNQTKEIIIIAIQQNGNAINHANHLLCGLNTELL